MTVDFKSEIRKKLFRLPSVCNKKDNEVLISSENLSWTRIHYARMYVYLVIGYDFLVTLS